MINDESFSGKKFDRTLVLKACAFFAVILAAVLTAAYFKLVINPHLVSGSIFKALLPIALQAALILAALAVYLVCTRAAVVASPKDLYAIGVALVVSYATNIFLSQFSVFAAPTALAAFIIVPIAKRRDAFIANLFCNFLILGTLMAEYVYAAPDAAYTVFHVIDAAVMFTLGVTGGTVAAYTLSNKTGRFGYVVKGAAIGAATYIAIILFSIVQRIGAAQQIQDVVDYFLAEALPYGAVCAFSPVLLGTLLQPLFERSFNLITDARLVELTDHNSPLIKRLRTEAPGTFSHSLAVASFAEICASAIGENPHFARAAAYYHDIGKLENPDYYLENQTQSNPHDELLPEVSAEIIRAHTTDGLKLCEEYRIPHEISEVTVQHHGTLLIPVFYEKAKKLTDSPVDMYEYSYHGITPTSKIAAIIMLCDAGEAAIRTIESPDAEKVDKLMTGLIEARILAGQFKDCDISLKDLETVKKTIISAYGGLYHKRMKYPGGK